MSVYFKAREKGEVKTRKKISLFILGILILSVFYVTGVSYAETEWILFDDFSIWDNNKWGQWNVTGYDNTETCGVVNGSLTSTSSLTSPTKARFCNFRTKNFDLRDVQKVKIDLYFNAKSTNGEARGNFWAVGFCNNDAITNEYPYSDTENCSGIFIGEDTTDKGSCPPYTNGYGSIWGAMGGCSDNGTLIMTKKNVSDPLSEWSATFNGNLLDDSIPAPSRTGVPWRLELYSYKVASAPDGNKNVIHEYHMYDIYYELKGNLWLISPEDGAEFSLAPESFDWGVNPSLIFKSCSIQVSGDSYKWKKFGKSLKSGSSYQASEKDWKKLIKMESKDSDGKLYWRVYCSSGKKLMKYSNIFSFSFV